MGFPRTFAGEPYYHIFSKGEDSPDLFCKREDLVRAVNLIGVLSNWFDIRIMAFCLEDTHIHILLKTDIDACIRFKREYRRMIRRWGCRGFELYIEKVTDP